MSSALIYDHIWHLPKTDLHRHIDGAIKPKTVMRLAKKLGVKLPTNNLMEFTKLYQIIEPQGMPVDQLFQRFGWGIAVMRTPEGIYEVFREEVRNLANENILYSESRFAPGYHSIYPAPWYKPEMYEEKPFPVMSLDQTVKYALAGLEQGMKETGIVTNLILCIPRESLSTPGQGPKSVNDIVDLALRFQGDGVVGLDLACDEFRHKPDPYIPYLRRTIGTNIRRVPHGGEMGEDADRLRNIEVCLNPKKINANGIGHGYPLWQSPHLMGLTRKKNIRVERTPLSLLPNCSMENGRLDVLLENQVPVVITSDDPVLMKTTLSDNWEALLKYHNYGEKEFWQMTANALNTGFFRNEDQKKAVQKRFIKRGLSKSLLKK